MPKKRESDIPKSPVQRRITISSPRDFQHLYHVTFAENDSTFFDVPPSWRKQVATKGESACSIVYSKSLNQSGGSHNRRRARLNSMDDSMDPPPELFSDLCDKEIFSKIKKYHPPFQLDSRCMTSDSGNFSFYCGCSNIENPDSDQKSNLIAVKKIDLTKYQSFNMLMNELEFHYIGENKNVIKFLESYFYNDTLWLVFTDDGDITLAEVIHAMHLSVSSIISHNRFKTEVMAYLCHEILSGITYIHSNDFIHRDIKSDNVLLSSAGEVRICDFSLCCPCKENSHITDRVVVGSPYWMAPEIILKRPYDKKVDIWSFGCIVMELLEGAPPYFELSAADAMNQVATTDVDFLPRDLEVYGALLKPFMECCLNKSRVGRASASQLLIHPFLKNKANMEEIPKLFKENSLKY